MYLLRVLGNDSKRSLRIRILGGRAVQICPGSDPTDAAGGCPTRAGERARPAAASSWIGTRVHQVERRRRSSRRTDRARRRAEHVTLVGVVETQHSAHAQRGQAMPGRRRRAALASGRRSEPPAAVRAVARTASYARHACSNSHTCITNAVGTSSTKKYGQGCLCQMMHVANRTA